MSKANIRTVKPRSIAYIVKRLREMTCLKRWKITGSNKIIRLRPPKTHWKFAGAYRTAIERELKAERVMPRDIKVLLITP